MSEEEFVYHLIFLLFAFCVIYPPTEFEAIGFTIDNFFGSFFGLGEELEFVQFHLRRTCFVVLVHAFLPLAYVVCYFLKFGIIFITDASTLFDANVFIAWNAFVIFAFTAPIYASAMVFIWHRNNWNRHPIVDNLRKYCNADSSWERVADDINTECRR